MSHVFSKILKTKTLTVPKSIIDMIELNKNILRTIEAQSVQKLKNNEARPNLLALIKKACTSRLKSSICKTSSASAKKLHVLFIKTSVVLENFEYSSKML